MHNTLRLLPLRAYIDAATNTATKLCMDLHRRPNGEPILCQTDGFIRFELSDRKHNSFYLSISTDRWLTAPTDVVERIKSTSAIAGLASARLLPLAATTQSPSGLNSQHDAILQERNTNLHSYITSHIAHRNTSGLRDALQSLTQLLHTLEQQGLMHGNINTHTVQFSAQGDIRLLDYPTSLPNPSHPRHDDTTSLAQVAILLFVAACNSKAYSLLHKLAHNTDDQTRRMRCIASAAEHHGLLPLATLTKELLGRAERSVIIAAVEALSIAPFKPIPLIEKLLAQTDTPTVELSHTPLPPVEKVDFATCEQVLPASAQLVRFRKFDRWGYASRQGRVLHIGRPLLAAFEFSGGRAVVRTANGYGLINERGEWVMRDEWSDLGWFGCEGVATACDREGRWHLFCGSTGRQLSIKSADWMGEAAEGFVVARRGNLYGFYATDGTVASRFAYERAYGFFRGSARVRCRGEWFYIDTSLHRLSAKQAEEADALRQEP